MKRLILIVIFLNVVITGRSQFKKKIEMGLSYGFNFNTLSAIVNYNLVERSSLAIEIYGDKYLGLGLGLSTKFSLLKSKLRPCIEMTYSEYLGESTGYGDEQNSSIIKVTQSKYLSASTICRYDIKLSKENARRFSYFSYFIKIGMKIKLNNNRIVEYESGPPLNDEFNKINNYTQNSIIGSVGFILTFK